MGVNNNQTPPRNQVQQDVPVNPPAILRRVLPAFPEGQRVGNAPMMPEIPAAQNALEGNAVVDNERHQNLRPRRNPIPDINVMQTPESRFSRVPLEVILEAELTNNENEPENNQRAHANPPLLPNSPSKTDAPPSLAQKNPRNTEI